MKAARALTSHHPELERTLSEGSSRTAWFLARFGISPAQFRAGAPDECAVRFPGD